MNPNSLSAAKESLAHRGECRESVLTNKPSPGSPGIPLLTTNDSTGTGVLALGSATVDSNRVTFSEGFELGKLSELMRVTVANDGYVTRANGSCLCTSLA
jgi:hypothetical protein